MNIFSDIINLIIQFNFIKFRDYFDFYVAEAVVLELFLITEGKKKNVPVAGCRCISGELKKQSMYKVMRNGVEVFRG